MRPSFVQAGWSARWALLCCAAVGTACAEPVQNGTWRATFATERAEQQHATFVVDGSEGVWTVLPQAGQAQEDRCAGRPLPVTLRDSGASTVSLSMAASQVDPHCEDFKARLTVVDADTLEGEFENGRIVRLERITPRR